MVTEPLIDAIALPDGTLVRGRGRSQPVPPGPVPDFGLYLGRPQERCPPVVGVPRRQVWRPQWPADWVEWPDFGVPRDESLAADRIRHAYDLARGGQRVEVACLGGTGRTGTVIACMAVLAGHPADQALVWTRGHYRPRAVETPGQRRWIAWFAAHVAAR